MTLGEEPITKNHSSQQSRVDFWTRRRATPTYDVTGDLERFDMRDTLDHRAALVPGTERYKQYYSLHPECEERDKKLRVYGPVPILLGTAPARSDPEAFANKEERRVSLFGDEPLAMALSNAKGVGSLLGAADCGPVSASRVTLEPGVASRNIKGVARYLGADLVGICEVNPAWSYSHWGRDDISGARWGDPIEVTHRYAIVLAVAHDFDMVLAGRGTGISPTIETTFTVYKSSAPAIPLTSYIRALGYPAEAQISYGKLNSVAVAVDAGLGEVGRNGLLITKEYGPAVRICIVTTDLPLAVDMPVDLGVQDFCTRCFKCVDTCSSGSITRKDKEVIRGVKLWPVDNESCLRLRLSQGGAPSCFNCLSCCPYTKPRNFIHQTAGWLAARSSLSRKALVWLDDALYGRVPKQHPFPDWLEYDAAKRGLKKRFSIFLHKV